ncbi:hypothetical protein K440DRAFT_635450 [Wilcoxina mikolae CBS 423.85]|nr:hypothetical protein K440DRAFT_635450 [Wilcoxina mikolae CBS 423.85]
MRIARLRCSTLGSLQPPPGGTQSTGPAKGLPKGSHSLRHRFMAHLINKYSLDTPEIPAKAPANPSSHHFTSICFATKFCNQGSSTYPSAELRFPGCMGRHRAHIYRLYDRAVYYIEQYHRSKLLRLSRTAGCVCGWAWRQYDCIGAILC